MNLSISSESSDHTAILSPEKENALAHAVQHAMPLNATPFAELGRSLGISEDNVLAQVRHWSESGLLREISAVLEGACLGYDSALVAGKIPEPDIDRVAEVINAHPTVTHNYIRRHDYNLWFTIAVPMDQGLESHLELLAKEAGADAFYPLRRTSTFKVGVNFDLLTRRSRTEVVELSPPVPIRVSDRDRALFRALQTPLEITSRPFATTANKLGLGEGELIQHAQKHIGGAVRRFVGTFRHRRLGVRGNGMGVWNVPQSQHARLGSLLAGAPEVSHCYARNAVPGFDYTLYSMLHGPSEEACLEIAARLSREIDVDDYLVLFSTVELKKCRLRYFLPELDTWFSTRMGDALAGCQQPSAE